MLKYTADGTDYTTAALSSDPDIERVVSVTSVKSNNFIDQRGSVSTSARIDSSSIFTAQFTYTLAKLGVDSEGNTPIQSLTSFLNGRTPITYIDADEWSGSGTYTDSILGLSWSVVNGSKATVDGVESIDLETNNNRYMETATRNTVGQNYVHFYAWRPRVSNSGWRTLFRGDNDHWVIVQNNATDLGMYSNRNGAFRDTGYDLTAGEWQTLIVVGVGDSATATTGTQTYYVNGVNVGTTDRVVSGTNTYRLGWTDSQSPGYIKVAGVINSTLTSAEIIELNDILNAKIGGNSNTIGYSEIVGDTLSTSYIDYSGDLSADFSVNRTPNTPSITTIQSTQRPEITTKFSEQIVALRSKKGVELGNPNFSFEVFAKQLDDFDDTFRSTHKTVFTNVTIGSSGGGDTVVVQSGPVQTWY